MTTRRVTTLRVNISRKLAMFTQSNRFAYEAIMRCPLPDPPPSPREMARRKQQFIRQCAERTRSHNDVDEIYIEGPLALLLLGYLDVETASKVRSPVYA